MFKHKIIALITLSFLSINLTNITSCSAVANIVLNEIEENPYGTDAGYEWVELYNPTTKTLSLAGWSVETNHGIKYRVTLPLGASISPNGYYIVSRSTQWIDNEDDYVILRNGVGIEVDRSPVLVDTSNNGLTWQRYPNGKDTGSTSDWSFRSSTRGASNGATATLTVISPNGGQSWVRGTTHTLMWTSTGSPGLYVKIELLKGEVVNRIITPSTDNDGSYSWSIQSTQIVGTDYKIRITSTSNTAITDLSNANFVITLGALMVTSPNGGQSWVHGTTHTITWSSSGSPGTYIKIELLKAGIVNRVISLSTANDGSYSWTISSTQTVGTDYKIRITSTTNTAIKDLSNANFAIIT